MDYIRKEADGQLAFTQSTDFLKIPSCLYGFHNETTTVKTAYSGRQVFCFEGTLDASEEDLTCTCGSKMHVNNHPGITLRHLPFGSRLSCVTFSRNQYVCPKCRNTRMQFISFKAPRHRITEELYQYTCDLLASGVYTGSIIFLVGLTWPRYHSPKPYASLDMNLRQCAGEAPRRRRTQEQL